jgi:hypothetical protein
MMILHEEARVASRRPGTARPHTNPGAALASTARAPSGSAPGWCVVALEGGRWDATPCPPSPAAAVLVAGHPGDSLPARRGHGLVAPPALVRHARY